ncbi:MAG: O-antigen ligase family protein [bacterium]|nr:O-antigen ligase family protein [bacterium]
MISIKIKNLKLKILDIVYTIQLITVGLVIAGFIPREVILVFVAWLIFYIAFTKLEDSAIFFVRSIPFFIALPITTTFDQLNTWRIISGIIFLKWLVEGGFNILWLGVRNFFKKPVNFLKEHKFIFLTSAILLVAVLSLSQAQNLTAGVKRIIYFINLSLVGIVAYDLISRNKDFAKRVIKNIAIPTVAVAIIGFIQLAMTYLMDIYQFMRIWGEGIECRLFGNEWCYIASWVGNTWFAYFGDQLSLRMFSIFPDSHSFPIFILLGLSSIFAVSIYKVTEKAGNNAKQLYKIRAKMSVLFVPVIFLAVILSGTRGMWLAGGVTLICAFIFSYLFFKNKPTSKNIFRYLASYIFIFVLLFGLAYPIFASPQFLLSKDNSELLSKRVRSIIDFGETSNKLRLEIWKQTFESIKKRPLLGVGIGNFPVVLGQDVKLARAGSSAHNLYLNIFAEMGALAFILSAWFLWLLLKKVYENIITTGDSFLLVYNMSALMFIFWVMAYSMTDIAIFDERAFLMFATVVAVILGVNKKLQVP